MENQDDLIGLLESILPSDLVCRLSSEETNTEHFFSARDFIFREVAEFYFNTIIRKILVKQVEMRESNPSEFHSDCLYSKETMSKYMKMLPDDDDLKIRWNKAEFGDSLDDAKHFGLI